MDAIAIMAGCVRDEALRYLYLLSLHGSPRALIAAVAVGVAGAMLVGLAFGNSRPRLVAQLLAARTPRSAR